MGFLQLQCDIAIAVFVGILKIELYLSIQQNDKTRKFIPLLIISYLLKNRFCHNSEF